MEDAVEDAVDVAANTRQDALDADEDKDGVVEQATE